MNGKSPMCDGHKAWAALFYSQRLPCWTILLALMIFLAGCTPTPQPVVKKAIPTKASIHRLALPARQQLRDLTANFAVGKGGADTGIPVTAGERVVILASGSGTARGPEGDRTCNATAMPEPKQPCYALLYSVGLTGQADSVGAQRDFVALHDGNIFLGVNIPSSASASGTFQVTILTIPAGTVEGVWASPLNNFVSQGSTLTLAVKAFSHGIPISNVLVTASQPGQLPTRICTIPAPDRDGSTYSCDWNMTTGTGIFKNGPVTFGFSITTARGNGQANPDGTRAGMARYVYTQTNDIYAGYAAVSLLHRDNPVQFRQVTGRWTVPAASCNPGEESQVAIWSGMTGLSDNSKLAQLGSLSACEGGSPTYSVGWEMFPEPLVMLKNPVQPGDTITASVNFQNGQFQLMMDSDRQGWHFSITQPGVAADTAIAECIVEAPTVTVTGPNVNRSFVAQLTNFGTVSVSCQSDKGPIGNGAQNVLYQMNAQDGTSKATTTSLNQDGSTFKVQWKHG